MVAADHDRRGLLRVTAEGFGAAAAQIAPTAGRTQVAPIEELGIGGRRRHGAEVVGDLGWTAALPARTAAADR